MGVRARLIAFYLPQFHPVEENDAWWGKGFTEWRNVASARPLFRGHEQPHVPADLGFYDLRLGESRAQQAELARSFGIEGFCYWHYWFQGRRLLERPFREVLASGEPDFPFCLAWANESWSRRWLGEETDVLLKQTYSAEDDVAHARWVAEAMTDPRWIRVDLPEPRRTTDTLRSECVNRLGAEPLLLGINAHCTHVDCTTLGFDGTLSFEPQLGILPGFADEGPTPRKLVRNLRLGVPSATLRVYDDSDARGWMARAARQDWPLVPCVYARWDNTPRRGRAAIVIRNTTPASMGDALERAILAVSSQPEERRLVFLNAWNEWAEGNHLEPDLRHGTSFLEEVRRAARGEAR
jgi:lipopolysaccharide biosynthesis protein